MRYHLVSDQAAGSFSLCLIVSDARPAKKLFAFTTGADGTLLKPATVQSDGKQEWLEDAAAGAWALIRSGRRLTAV